MAEENYLLGRQPILNCSEKIVAYELLFRSAGTQSAVVWDASQATASVIINTLTGFGIEEILGEKKGFINLDLELLMDDSLHLLPKESMVIEILETVQPTQGLVDQCRFLKESGYTLALDDHEYSPAFQEIYEIIDIVKLDLIQTRATQLKEMANHFRRYPIQLLAEKVETQEQFQTCLELGFDLFQGYYFAKPLVMEKKRLDESMSTLLKLIRLLNEDAELAEIEKTFKASTGLTYKLLLLVNSVGIGTRNKIETVRHAMTMIGRQQLKRWIQLALFASRDDRGMENPLVDMAVVRASFMENLAGRVFKSTQDSAEKAFMTGILSLLERVYDVPIDEVVHSLNLSEDINDALTSRAGGYGKLLHVAESLEQMDFGHIAVDVQEMGGSVEDVTESLKGAYAWRSSMT